MVLYIFYCILQLLKMSV